MAHQVRVIRSTRRKRTISAKLVGDTIEVRVPSGMPAADEEREVAQVVERLQVKLAKNASSLTDAQLAARAKELNATVLEGRARFTRIRWVTNQNSRWASCTAGTGEIRVSHRLQDVPGYVLDAVIVHELVHTFIRTGHSAEFWEWADRAPKAERAKGYLEAYARQF
ncbi:M48 family metallopeptidase [Corynebacterium hindlerae]|uniref:M48 family metallopeptidase n=1 Tax=Corynebacterium hindlerae TaxID=699041 RepID=A0A7G5FH20_9CORY|nr:YgjP-like metallopeptidase domain-containing protein [Corynebacterium hindlerae]QMV85911.1 M48 family metallopeptidase [Corynebacterium hindlerae]